MNPIPATPDISNPPSSGEGLSVIPKLLTRPECARALRISPRMLDRMTKDRQIPCCRLGGRVLYRPDRVLAALDKLEDQPAA